MIKPRIDASWKKLLLVNYTIDPVLVRPYVPYNTEIAFYEDKCFISLVGFLFLNVRLMGIPFPFHTNFVEINLRFYVRRKHEDNWRYGVVFIREVVALPIVSLIANEIAGEHYATLPVRHSIIKNADTLTVEYGWKKQQWHSFKINCQLNPAQMILNSSEDFLTSQHWGYTQLKGKRAHEYSVEHPKWDIHKTKDYSLNVDFEKAYGSKFAFLNQQTPYSVFLAEGSKILMQKEKTMRSNISEE